MPIVFYTLLIDTININAVHLHNAKLTDLFAENESSTDSIPNRSFYYKRESYLYIFYNNYYLLSIFYKDRN